MHSVVSWYLFLAKHLFQRRVAVNEAAVLLVLQIVALDVLPELLDHLWYIRQCEYAWRLQWWQ